MNFRIANTIYKMRFAPRQTINSNVNPNNSEFAPKAQKTVKAQMAKAKHNLRKAFAQKPDEFIPAQTSEVETVPTKIKKLSKLSKHKKAKKTVIRHKHTKQPKKTVIPFENDTQEILTPLMSKEEEQQWIDFASRNRNTNWDYKPIEEHYKAEIEEKNLLQTELSDQAVKGYEKAAKAKTKEYFKDIEFAKPNPQKHNKNATDKIIEKPNTNGVVVNLNNRLLWF